MMFLLKTAFWLTLVLLVLPIDREKAGIAQGPGAFETFAAVQTVVSDMGGFCARNPSTCQTGAATVGVLRQKAVYSAGVVQGWLADEPSEQTIHVRNEPALGGGVRDDQVAALIEAANDRIPASAHPPL